MDNDLTAFLRARLDEDEAVAKAVCGLWRADVEGNLYDDSYSTLLATGPYGGGIDDATMAHITRHDPARVLREVEAKRAILAAHPLTDRVVPYGARDFPFGCETCHDWDGATEGLGYCDTLKALAAVYSDHADYRMEWKF